MNNGISKIDNTNKIEKVLSSHKFWIYLTNDEKDKMIAGSKCIFYKKNEMIHSASEKCQGIIFINKGELRTYILSEEGRDITLYRMYKGETCILSASCVLEAISFDVFINAEENSEVILTDALTFRSISENNIYLRCFAYEKTTERFSDVMWTMQQILFMGIDKRLAIYLWDMQIRTGSLTIKTTQEKIASSIGSVREVVSRMLKYFSQEGIVKIFRGGVEILDKQALKKIAFS